MVSERSDLVRIYGHTAVVTCLTVGSNSTCVVVLEGSTAVSRYAVRSGYEKCVLTVNNDLRGLKRCGCIAITVRLTVRSLGSCHVSVGNEGDNLVHINKLTLGLASGTVRIYTLATSIALRSDCIAALTSTYGLVGVSNLSGLVVTAAVLTLAVVTVSIIEPKKVVSNSVDYDLGTRGAVYGSRAIAIVLACLTLGVLVSTVFTCVAVNGRLVNAHLVEADITVVILVIIVTAGNVLPAVHAGMTPTLTVLAYGTTADVTHVVSILVHTLANGTAAVVTVVTTLAGNVLAHLGAANVTCVVGVCICTSAKSSAANVTEVIVGVCTLANLFTTVCTVVAVSGIIVSAYGLTADITNVVGVCINASSDYHTAMTAGMLALCRSVSNGDSVTNVALVILVLIYVL